VVPQEHEEEASVVEGDVGIDQELKVRVVPTLVDRMVMVVLRTPELLQIMLLPTLVDRILVLPGVAEEVAEEVVDSEGKIMLLVLLPRPPCSSPTFLLLSMIKDFPISSRT